MVAWEDIAAMMALGRQREREGDESKWPVYGIRGGRLEEAPRK